MLNSDCEQARFWRADLAHGERPLEYQQSLVLRLAMFRTVALNKGRVRIMSPELDPAHFSSFSSSPCSCAGYWRYLH